MFAHRQLVYIFPFPLSIVCETYTRLATVQVAEIGHVSRFEAGTLSTSAIFMLPDSPIEVNIMTPLRPVPNPP